MQKSRFAGAAGADYCQEFAFLYRETDIIDGPNSVFSFAIDFTQISTSKMLILFYYNTT